MEATAERAGIWRRVSTGNQDEAKQDHDNGAWITSHEYEVTRTYTVHGGSAHKRDRKFDRAWADVLEDMRHGRITVLVAWKLDRIDRKLNTFRMLGQVVEAGGRVEFVTEPHLNDLTTMGGRIALKVAEEIAYAESKTKSDRCRLDKADKRARGVLAGRYPWGYASEGPKDARRMVTTPAGEQYAPEAFTRVADGHALPAVAAWLSEVTGKTWHPRTVAAMIRNTTYRGEHRNGKGKTIHECPALVSGDLWRRANANLDARPSSRRGQRTDLAAGAAVLSGLACCANPACTAGPDSPVYKIMSGSGNQPRVAYYRCSGRGAQRRGCGTMVPMAAADALTDRVMGQLTMPVLRPVFHPATGHQTGIDDITQQLEDLPRQGLDEDAEDAERARLRAERRRLSALPATPAWTEYVPVTGDAGQPLTYGARWAASDQAQRRQWLRDAGFSVYLGKPGMDAGDDEDGEGALSAVDVYEDERALLVFRWRDDDDPGLSRGLA